MLLNEKGKNFKKKRKETGNEVQEVENKSLRTFEKLLMGTNLSPTEPLNPIFAEVYKHIQKFYEL